MEEVCKYLVGSCAFLIKAYQKSSTELFSFEHHVLCIYVLLYIKTGAPSECGHYILCLLVVLMPRSCREVMTARILILGVILQLSVLNKIQRY
jgi:hypothetical protein